MQGKKILKILSQNESRQGMQEFGLFIDDSGSPKPNIKDKSPYFAMGGVIVRRQDGDLVARAIEQFKEQWNIPLEVPLHGSEIRSRKNRFAWLGQFIHLNYQNFITISPT